MSRTSIRSVSHCSVFHVYRSINVTLQLRPVLWLSTDAIQLAVPIGDDGQLMSSTSCARPVLWLSTDAVQLAVPIGDDGQLMSSTSCARPVLFSLVTLTTPQIPVFSGIHGTEFG